MPQIVQIYKFTPFLSASNVFKNYGKGNDHSIFAYTIFFGIYGLLNILESTEYCRLSPKTKK